MKHKLISGEPAPAEEQVERREDFSGGSIASTSSGFSSLTKKRPPLFTSGILTFDISGIWIIVIYQEDRSFLYAGGTAQVENCSGVEKTWTRFFRLCDLARSLASKRYFS